MSDFEYKRKQKLNLDVEVIQTKDIISLFGIGEYGVKTYIRKNNIKPVIKGYYNKQEILKHHEKIKLKVYENQKTNLKKQGQINHDDI